MNANLSHTQNQDQSLKSPYRNLLYSSPQTQSNHGKYKNSSSTLSLSSPKKQLAKLRHIPSPTKNGYFSPTVQSDQQLDNYGIKKYFRTESISSHKPYNKDSDSIFLQTSTNFGVSKKLPKSFNEDLAIETRNIFTPIGNGNRERLSRESLGFRSTTMMFPRSSHQSEPVIGFAPGNRLTISQIGSREPQYFKYFVGKGNNDQIIRQVMLKRYWWKENMNGLLHFMWQPTSSGIPFSSLNTNKNLRQMANHFEGHASITTKTGLIKNLGSFCEKNKIDLFSITPITFVIDLHDPNYREEFQNFLSFYKQYSKIPFDQALQLGHFFAELSSPSKSSKALLKTSSSLSFCSSPKMNETMFAGSNIWLLKPTEYNQGRGINLFNKLTSLDYHLKSMQKGVENPLRAIKTPQIGKGRPSMIKSQQFVIQKYLEKPMLIDDRKFDIRVWVMLDHEMNLYCFKEKYIRLSSEPFSIDEKKVDDKYIHLTNNAVQKYGKNYGKHENGNIISFQDIKKYIKSKDPASDFNNINRRMKEIIKLSFLASREKMNPNDRKLCFEIFGFDFIIDSSYNTWLIEINTNPSIDESNDLLKIIIPRMIDDAFRLTIDKIFVPSEENYKAEDARDFDRQLEFPVNGYSSDENLWEHLSNLRLLKTSMIRF